jgi:hypothetical protein
MICKRCHRELPSFEYAWNHIFRLHPSLAFDLLLPLIIATDNHSERATIEERAT